MPSMYHQSPTLPSYAVSELAHSDAVICALGSTTASLGMYKGAIGWDLEGLERRTWETSSRVTDSDDESEEEVEQMLPPS